MLGPGKRGCKLPGGACVGKGQGAGEEQGQVRSENGGKRPFTETAQGKQGAKNKRQRAEGRGAGEGKSRAGICFLFGGTRRYANKEVLLVEIGADCDVEEADHHFVVGLVAPADFGVGVGIVVIVF